MILPYDERGQGPVVVLLHAGVTDRRMWREHLELLAAAGRRAVAPDLPAYGEAVPYGELAPWRDVLETMDAAGVDRASLVGNSFGAAVALRVAAVAPARVEHLVLAGVPPPGLEPSPELAKAWAAEEDALERGDIDAAVEAVLDAWTPQDAPELRRRVAEMQRRALELQQAAGELAEAEDPLEDNPEALRALEMPVLLLVGGRDFVDFTAGAERLERELPRARRVVWPEAGHLAPLEQPARFCQTVLDFLG